MARNAEGTECLIFILPPVKGTRIPSKKCSLIGEMPDFEENVPWLGAKCK